MPEFEIIPPDDERVLCKFTVPRKGKDPLKFSVRRIEFLSKSENEKWDKWWADRTSPTPVVDDNGDPVIEGDTQQMRSPDYLGNREMCLKALEVAGVPATQRKQIDALTDGEIEQIWDNWRSASRMSLGESQASADSSTE